MINGLETFNTVHGLSTGARLFVLACGFGLCFWSVYELRIRKLLISICSLLMSIGLALTAFAIVPETFDRISFMIGVKYPPLLYLILAILSLLIVVLQLASRLSIVDEQCRRVAQELALRKYENGRASNLKPEAPVGKDVDTSSECRARSRNRQAFPSHDSV